MKSPELNTVVAVFAYLVNGVKMCLLRFLITKHTSNGTQLCEDVLEYSLLHLYYSLHGGVKLDNVRELEMQDMLGMSFTYKYRNVKEVLEVLRNELVIKLTNISAVSLINGTIEHNSLESSKQIK